MSVDNLSNSQYTYNLIKKDLNVSSLRSKVIGNNLSNINTKNYKRYYVTFEDSLKNAQAQDGLALKLTNEKHIEDGSNNTAEPKILQDTQSTMNEDGNNVDIDNEMVNLAANTLMYNALISQANNRLQMERSVIEGK